MGASEGLGALVVQAYEVPDVGLEFAEKHAVAAGLGRGVVDRQDAVLEAVLDEVGLHAAPSAAPAVDAEEQREGLVGDARVLDIVHVKPGAEGEALEKCYITIFGILRVFLNMSSSRTLSYQFFTR